jgi:putative endonuclease
MFTVYILYSEKFNKTYVGFTSDLEKRFLSHNELVRKGWTVKFRPWKIIHTERFQTKEEAMRYEKFLKSGKGGVFVSLLVKK